MSRLRSDRERTVLARPSGLLFPTVVYAYPGGLEVDAHDLGEVFRTRVFYEDVVLVTHHQALGWPFLLGSGALATAGLAGAGALTVAGSGALAALLIGLVALPALVAFGLRIFLGVDVVTVVDKNARIRLPFWFRKAEARRLYREVGRRAREAQDAIAPPEEAERAEAADDAPASAGPGDAAADSAEPEAEVPGSAAGPPEPEAAPEPPEPEAAPEPPEAGAAEPAPGTPAAEPAVPEPPPTAASGPAEEPPEDPRPGTV